VGEGRRHHEARVAHGVAEIHQPALGQQDDAFAVGELDLVDLRLDIVPFQVLQRRDLDLGIEVPDVGDDGAVLHLAHVFDGNDIDVAGGGDENVGARRGVLHGGDLVAFHRRLQRADRIDFRDHDPAAGLAQRGRRAFADVAEAGDHRHLARHHDVGAATDTVDQRFAAAVKIVELRFGDAVVNIDGGEQEPAFLGHLIKPVHAGGGFLGDAADAVGDAGIPARLVLDALRDRREQHLFLFVVRVVEHGEVGFGLYAE